MIKSSAPFNSNNPPGCASQRAEVQRGGGLSLIFMMPSLADRRCRGGQGAGVRSDALGWLIRNHPPKRQMGPCQHRGPGEYRANRVGGE